MVYLVNCRLWNCGLLVKCWPETGLTTVRFNRWMPACSWGGRRRSRGRRASASSAAGRGGHRLVGVLVLGHRRRAVERAVVDVLAAHDHEVRAQASVPQHRRGVAADALGAPRLEEVVVVQAVQIGYRADGALVGGDLAVVLARVVQPGQLEQPE